MKGEFLICQAEQGYYPPRIAFRIRLKNNQNVLWHINASKATLYLESTKGVATLSTSVDFDSFELYPKDDYEFYQRFELDYKKLNFIEENRRGGLHFKLYLELVGFSRNKTGDGYQNMDVSTLISSKETIWVQSPDYHDKVVIPQSDWVEILEKLDYMKFEIIEMPFPMSSSFSELQTGIQRLQEAQRLLNEGKNEEVITKCRQAFEILNPMVSSKMSPHKSQMLPELSKQIDLGSKGQEDKPAKSERIEQLRQKIWQLLHIGPHEGYRITREDAEFIIFLCTSMARFYSIKLAEISTKPE